jgi:hypothetical protein
MKYITFLTHCDWANVLTDINLCINKTSTKYKSICVCRSKHFFNYTVKHEYNLEEVCCSGKNNCVDYNYILEHITKSDLIIMGCEWWNDNWIERLYPDIFNIINKKQTILYHANDIFFFNDKTKINFVVPEFNDCNKKLNIIIPGTPVDISDNIDEIVNRRYQNNKIVVTHVNSRNDGGHRKGSLIINEIMKKIIEHNKNIQYNFIDYQTKSFDEIMEIKKNTDIYIDQYNNDVGGFGTSSIEALKYGCIVLCTINKLNPSIFEIIEKDNFPIIDISGSIDNLRNILENICCYDKKIIFDITNKNIEWIKKNLSSHNICSILEKYFDDIIM